MADIVLYDRTGSAVTYSGVDTITTDTPTDGETATFTYGKVIEGTEINLALADGNQTVSVPVGSLVRKATIKKPDTLTPEHIKKGVDVAGVIGTFAGDETEKTVELNMANGDQIVDADPDTVMTRVTVKKPETLVPENIVEGVDIGGVVGTKTMVKAPHQLLDGTSGTFSLVDDMFDHPPTIITKASVFSGQGVNYVSLSLVSQIAESAFYNCQYLSEVNMPALEKGCGTLYSGYHAFASCVNLKAVNMQNLKEIPTGFFASCANLDEIILPSEISRCGYVAFGETKFYSDMPVESGIKYFNNVAVSAVSSVALSGVVKLKEGTTCIGDSAFYSWRGGITALYADDVKYIGEGAFIGQSMMSQAFVSNAISIYEKAFSGCSSLSNIDVPLCTYIGQSAFYNCIKLQGISTPVCSEIGSSAFYGCKSLSYAFIPSVSRIYNAAFSSCILQEISIPECSDIGYSGFYGCSSLASVFAPKLTNIGADCFYGCNKLETIYAPKLLGGYDRDFFGCNLLKYAYFPKLYTIYRSFFYSCYSLSFAYFEKANNIRSSAFAYCSRLLSLYLFSTSMVTLEQYASSCFYATPIYGVSTYAGAYGSIFVRQSLLNAYRTNRNWTRYSSRIVGLTDEEIETIKAEMEAKYETANSDTTV